MMVGRGSTKSLDLSCWMCQGDHLSEDCGFVRDWRGSILDGGEELQGGGESVAAVRSIYQRRTSSCSSSSSPSSSSCSSPCKRIVLLKHLPVDSDRVHQSTGYLPAFNTVR